MERLFKALRSSALCRRVAAKSCRVIAWGGAVGFGLLSSIGLGGPGEVAAQVSVGTLQRVSTGPGDITPMGNAGAPIASPNGRFIAFHSTDPQIVSNDQNSQRDVFVRDQQTGVTQRLSVSTVGIEGDGESRNPSISGVDPQGIYVVVFESDATNLAPTTTDNNDFTDIYMSFPTLARTYLLSFNAVGLELADGGSFAPSVAGIPAKNRLLVAFSSDATNLATDGSVDSNQQRDIYLTTIDYRDIQSADPSADMTVIRIGQPPDSGGSGLESDGDSDSPQVSGNGRFVVFTSRATNLTPEGNSGFTQIYLYDINTGTTTLISKDALGLPGDANSSAPSISYNGRFISYVTAATNISDAATLGRTHVIRYDTSSDVSELVSSTAEGAVGDGNASDAQIGPNGRFVTFSDSSSNLVANDGNSTLDVFVKDFESGEVVRASVALDGGDPDGASTRGTLVSNGFNSVQGTVSFLSQANNLILNDVTSSDVYAASVSVPLPALRDTTTIEVPPDIELKRKRTLLTFQAFSGVVSASTAALNASLTNDGVAAAEGDETVRYQYRIRGRGVRIDNRAKLAKKTRIGIRGLKPGTYTARYRAVVVKDGAVQRRTPFSPPQRFKRTRSSS